jgi:hypothetical protein
VTADIHLSPVPSLHLFVRDPTEDRRGFRMPIIQRRIFDSQEFVRAEETSTVAPGVYEIMGVRRENTWLVLERERLDGSHNPAR